MKQKLTMKELEETILRFMMASSRYCELSDKDKSGGLHDTDENEEFAALSKLNKHFAAKPKCTCDEYDYRDCEIDCRP